jgi:hypothetical protein
MDNAAGTEAGHVAGLVGTEEHTLVELAVAQNTDAPPEL